MLRSRLEYALWAAIIVLLPFQNVRFMKAYIGEIGGVLSYYPALVLIFFELYKKIKFNQINLNFVYGLIYSIVITIIGLMYFGFYSHGQNLILKAVTNGLVWLVFIYISFFAQPVKLERLTWALKLALMLMTFWLLFYEIWQVIPEIPFLNDKHNLNMRARGLTHESSHLAFFLVTVIALLISNSSSRLKKFFWVSIMLALTLLAESKGGIVVAMIYMFHYLWVGRKLFIKMLGLCAIVLVLDYVFLEFRTLFELSITIHSTVGTRLTAFHAAFLGLISLPFGAGLGAWLPYYTGLIMPSIESINSYGFQFNFSEIMEYVSQADDKNISGKSSFVSGLLVWGIPFIYVVYKSHINIWTNLNIDDKRLMLIMILAGLLFIEIHMFMSAALTYCYLRSKRPVKLKKLGFNKH